MGELLHRKEPTRSHPIAARPGHWLIAQGELLGGIVGAVSLDGIGAAEEVGNCHTYTLASQSHEVNLRRGNSIACYFSSNMVSHCYYSNIFRR